VRWDTVLIILILGYFAAMILDAFVEGRLP